MECDSPVVFARVFNVPNLSVGSYRVRIEAQGLRGYTRIGLSLNANRVISVVTQLTVAPVETSIVEVADASPVIDTETSTLAT